ncbi:hypothetical protein CLAFUW4_02237 [Fulvia fulva]|uniref:Uncharacterized protein n=1 Tax=Passalora fulva TaxID=5499 RepID=A0A9Q8L7W0_PASFU|nr:uncharacterized protein CLAFUR5_02227 [Fulvia fulva]KAK4635535.1 hypothetical protein CLAFUR4_02232 [Fulvia fulva]KAK4637621.1 hypothetical protein CLAFUR0_02235 [Fulvia fulva]UJO12416.1 hypothetical protein CLAFUR5_02227 [Fulvia fulva]WPV09495.1 hypothetical protein CLAFUW4_02237 [Fulvia fulva]WPV25063.1 hypothetical protein CLAFUW7_02237 [Fulvia fulva]
MSNLVVGLNLYSSHAQECALAIDQLGPCLLHENLTPALGQLRSISMRLSHSVAGDAEDRCDDDDSDESSIPSGNAPSDSKNVEAKPLKSISNDINTALDPASYVRHFLNVCPPLQSLHIH